MFDFDSMPPDIAREARLKFGGPAPAPPRKRTQGPSKLETRFHNHLLVMVRAGRLGAAGFASTPVELAHNTAYWPDFFARDLDRQHWWIELKGEYEYDDGCRTKIKVAASMYPETRWLFVQERHGSWYPREVTAAKGIARKRITLPWI